jgi:hypothetical protein
MELLHVAQPLTKGGPPKRELLDMWLLGEENFLIDVGVGLEDKCKLFLSYIK